MKSNIVQSPSSGFAIASLIFGIAAILSAVLAPLATLFGVVAIVLGSIALRRKAKKGLALSGIITGSFAVLLAIVFTIIFIVAIPALQRSQRDTQRRSDVEQLTSELEAYKSGHHGMLPTDEEVTSGNFLSLLKDPKSGKSYTVTTDRLLAVGDIDYLPGEDCDGNKSAGSFSFETRLESNKNYCSSSTR